MKDETLILLLVGVGAYFIFFSPAATVVPPVGAMAPGPDNSNLGVPPLGQPNGPFDKSPTIRDHRRQRPDPTAGQGTGGSTTNTTPNLPNSVPALVNDVRKVAVKPTPPKLPPGQTPDTIPHDGPGQNHVVVSFPTINLPTANPLAKFVQSTVTSAKTAAKSAPAKVASAPPTAPRAGSGIPSFKKANL